MSKHKDSFCVLPWNSVNIRANGDLRICCNANSYTKSKGMLRKEDGTVYNSSKDDWNDARNSELLKEVRLAMLNGEWHPECERCKQEESAGQYSRRKYESMIWKEFTIDKARDITSEDGIVDTEKQDIDYIDIRYGNFCNLKCRMCGPTDSHTWYEDFLAIYNTDNFEDTHGVIELKRNEKGRLYTTEYEWFVDNETYYKNFEKYAQHTKRMYVVGGEPLIIKEHHESLKKLIATGASKQINLEYNTNLTNITSEILDMWKHFKTVKVGASIDGFGKVFEYQRNPANWNSVLKNIRVIDEHTGDNVIGVLSYTVTSMNVFHLPEFMQWKLESGLTKFNILSMSKPVISFHMCHGPLRYNIKSLPTEMKTLVRQVYQQYREWILSSSYDEKIINDFIHILDSVESFMLAENLQENFFGKGGFVEMTKKLDKLRNENILDIVPAYRPYFE